MAHVYDAPIHYIVLIQDDNTVTIPWMEEYMALLDKIEATTGPGILVTIGVGKKHFSTGFDLPTWIGEPETYYPSMELLRVLMDRLIRLSMPSLCVFNGNAMAGGYFMGLCHDFRLMNSQQG